MKTRYTGKSLEADMSARDKSVSDQMKPRMPSVQDSARYMPRTRWGCSKSITKADYQWLLDNYGSKKPVATAVEMALKLAGLWDQYVAAGLPTWSAFRQWINSKEVSA